MNIQSENCSILQEYPQLNPAPAFLNSTTKGHFTLWPKVERPLISTNQIARNQEFGLSTLHTMTKVQRLSLFWMITFWRRRRTLEGSLDQTGMEAQTMVERPSVSFPKKQSLTRSWPLDWRGYFEQGIKWHAPLDLDFGVGLWRLHTMPGRWLHLPYFISYSQLISLDCQQSLATQSHGLLTWTAIVWSGPN